MLPSLNHAMHAIMSSDGGWAPKARSRSRTIDENPISVMVCGWLGVYGISLELSRKPWHVEQRMGYQNVGLSRLVPRFQKGSRSWFRWVQGLGPWWILDLARLFCRGTLETQDLKIVLCRKTLETQDLKIFICRETLKTQDLKILTVARPWQSRTLKFGYVAKPWKTRTQNLKILMSRDL